jgi:hypothetical protein
MASHKTSMKRQPIVTIAILIFFTSLIINSGLVGIVFAQASTTSTGISSYGAILQNSPAPTASSSPTPSVAPTTAPTPTTSPSPSGAPTSTPTPTDYETNSIWCQAGSEITLSQSQFYATKDISYVLVQTGYWLSNGNIGRNDFPSDVELRTAVSNAHNAGLKIYAWITSQENYGSIIDVSASKRQTEINNMINLVNTYNFDGIADDVEAMNPWSYTNLVSYYNDATAAMHNLGKEYFTAMISYWGPNMGSTLFNSIHVDRMQPMLYGNYPSGQTETKVKEHMDFFLRYSSSPVGLAIHSDYPDYYALSDAMTWVDEQLASGTPSAKLAGIDIFWVHGMTQSQWNAWSNWNTKN